MLTVREAIKSCDGCGHPVVFKIECEDIKYIKVTSQCQKCGKMVSLTLGEKKKEEIKK